MLTTVRVAGRVAVRVAVRVSTSASAAAEHGAQIPPALALGSLDVARAPRHAEQGAGERELFLLVAPTTRELGGTRIDTLGLVAGGGVGSIAMVVLF